MSLNQSLISDFSEYYRWSQRTKIKYKLHYGSCTGRRFTAATWHNYKFESFYPFNAFIYQSFDFRGCKSDSDHFPSCTCISMVLCVYAYRNWLQHARFSLLYAIDAKYHFDITLPNSFRNIERSKNYRHTDFIYSLFYSLVVVVEGVDGGGGEGVQPVKIISLILSRVNR